MAAYLWQAAPVQLALAPPLPPVCCVQRPLFAPIHPAPWPLGSLQSWRLLFTKRYSPMLIITVLINMFQQW